MSQNKKYIALGLMSGTSLDGIDAAIIKTDGYSIENFGPFESEPYDARFKARLYSELGKTQFSEALQKELTYLHAEFVRSLFLKHSYSSSEIDIIGFHGQTIYHNPNERFTLQIGDGALSVSYTHLTLPTNREV